MRFPRHSRFPSRVRGLGASGTSIPSLVAQAANNAGINPGLALAVAQQESGLNPSAVSSKGAQGVMQLMPATAAQLGVTNPLDPAQNVQGGVSYLSQLLNQFGGDETAALAAYNWGPGNVQNAMAQYGSNWLAYAPAETQNYVASIQSSAGGSVSIPAFDPSTDSADAGSLTDLLGGIDVSGTSPWLYIGLAAGALGLAWALS